MKFRTQLMLLSVLLMALSVYLTAQLSTIRFSDALWEQDGIAMNKQFDIVENQILDLLGDAAYESVLTQQQDDVVDFFLSGIRHVPVDPKSVTYMLHGMTTQLHRFNSLSGLLFLQNGRLYGVTPDWNFTGVQAPESLLARLAETPVTGSIYWFDTFALQDFIRMPLTTQSLREQQFLVGMSRSHLVGTAGARDITILSLVSIDEIDPLLMRIGTGALDVVLCNADGAHLAGTYAAMPVIPADSDVGEMDYSAANIRYRVFYSRMRLNRFLLACRVEKSLYQRQSAQLRLNGYAIGGLCIAIMAAIYLFLAHLFFRPLLQIKTLLNRVRSGEISTRLAPFHRLPPIPVDMEDMRTQINGMLDSIEQLIADRDQANRERTQLQMRALQGQLNPHMIFNTITSIRWMILLQKENWPGSENVSAMLVEFASLLQPVFDEWRPEWTLREEFNYIHHYIALLQMRYCADFHIVNLLDDALFDMLIPRFCLQPILENSCEHGIAGNQSVHVDLTTYRDGAFLCLAVADNGCGITPAMLALLRARLNGAEPETTSRIGRRSIGLINVHRQLQAQFGVESGLVIESTEGHGTCVTLRMRIPPPASR